VAAATLAGPSTSLAGWTLSVAAMTLLLVASRLPAAMTRGAVAGPAKS
jgi:hypothetical protein